MLTSFLLLAVIALTAVACVTDFRVLRIPNYVCLAIALLFFVGFFAQPEFFLAWWSHFGACLFMFLLGFVLFIFRLYGAGDIKLAAVLALWLGLQGLFAFVFFMALAGGVLGALALYISKKKPFSHPLPESWVAQLQNGRNAMPYGIAISSGFWAAVFHTPHLADQLHEVISLVH